MDRLFFFRLNHKHLWLFNVSALGYYFQCKSTKYAEISNNPMFKQIEECYCKTVSFGNGLECVSTNVKCENLKGNIVKLFCISGHNSAWITKDSH